jgi:hypothetical protein
VAATWIATVHADGCAIFSGGVCDCDPAVMTMDDYRRQVGRN